MKLFLRSLGFLAATLPCFGATKVATLHPILADLARQVGGANVEVVEILKPGADVHHFEPAPKDLAEMRGAKLLLASGKGLESFLDKLRDSLGAGVKLVEVGAKIPSIPFVEHEHHHEGKEEEHEDHHHGSEDPHWWHSAENMKRAARIVADELSAVDPANAAAYAAGAKAASKRFGELKSWAQKEIAKIDRKSRQLVTAHAAFGYFCKEYGFEPLSVLSIGRSDDSSSKHIAETIEEIREHGIKAIFPEDQANPKVLAEIARSTGVKIGEPLIADGTAKVAHTFETMLAHNVRAIVAALAPAPVK
ncbi:metal ABC transporter substrate-binding protein [Prosthecobacter sp.]|jgi:ABC-type Zn uptake system ZnuABC Zn-binding protein ZnuA|uniref:metal ABC transporter substrate-binding protein n=1 Tax=Prosthecobacter sp. TaxID=1965333 RepID=UPI0037C4F4D2